MTQWGVERSPNQLVYFRPSQVGDEAAKKRGDDSIDDSHIVETPPSSSAVGYEIGSETRPSTRSCARNARVLEERSEMPARSKTIKTRYENVADSHAVDPLTTLKGIQNQLLDRHMLGFLKRTDRNRGESGGRYDEYGLDLDAEVVITSRDEIETEHTR